MGFFRIYKGEKAGVRLTLVPCHKGTKTEVTTSMLTSERVESFIDVFRFQLVVEAVNWPKTSELPATVNSASVITTWLNEISGMPKHVMIHHRLANGDSTCAGAVSEWYNNICVGKWGFDDDDELLGLFWGTGNLKAIYSVEITEREIVVNLDKQLKSIREYSEENFKKYGVLTPQDPNVFGRLPWRIFDPGDGDPCRELSIVDADNNRVTTLGPLEDTTDMTLGNALFILKCVNNSNGNLANIIGIQETAIAQLREELDKVERVLNDVKNEV